MANTNDLTMAALFQRMLIVENKVDGLLTLAKTPSGSKGKKSKAGGEAKPRAPSSWNLFIGRVSKVLQDNGEKGTGLMAFCGHLKASNDAYMDLEDEDILLARASWTPPEVKPKEAKPKEEKPEGEAKPKRFLSDAQKEAMAEGRRKALAKKKAEKEAAAAGASEPESPKPASPKVVQTEDLVRFPFKGKVYLKDPTTGGMWLKAADGSKGAWAGVLKDGKLDVTVAEP